MAKTTGLGDRLIVNGYDLSGDIGSIEKIASPLVPLDVTGIDKSAYERIGGKRDGAIDFMAFFNTDPGAEHPILSALPTTDIQVMYIHGQGAGSPSATMTAKQVNYDPTRGADGSLTEKISCVSSAGTGIVWGEQFEAIRTDTTATTGATYDTGVITSSLGWSAQLQALALTGTSATVTIQDSADGASWANLAGGAFAPFTGPGGQLLTGGPTATVRQYLRANTTGTFTSAKFTLTFTRN